MIRSFVGAFLWFTALWWVGAWVEAYTGLPGQLGVLAGVVVAGLFIGHGLRLALGVPTTRSQAPEAVTAN